MYLVFLKDKVVIIEDLESMFINLTININKISQLSYLKLLY